ncbi:hypothetical protein [Glutamicibacter sp.]|uniref:hypothetical protein n=1 Tax=Glutamicibacter sp. TaxID=1931995 RepID=UPI003D6AAE1A
MQRLRVAWFRLVSKGHPELEDSIIIGICKPVLSQCSVSWFHDPSGSAVIVWDRCKLHDLQTSAFLDLYILDFCGGAAVDAKEIQGEEHLAIRVRRRADGSSFSLVDAQSGAAGAACRQGQ